MRWRGFVMKSGLDDHAAGWAETVAACRRFLQEPISASAENRQLESRWNPGGPWRPSTP